MNKKPGRPKNSGPYGEPTVQIRVPVSMVDKIRQMILSCVKKQSQN